MRCEAKHLCSPTRVFCFTIAISHTVSVEFSMSHRLTITFFFSFGITDSLTALVLFVVVVSSSSPTYNYIKVCIKNKMN
jgi:hypothetical protein